MNHRDHVQAYKAKHGPPPDFDYELWAKLEQAVKERADKPNQGESDGRETED